MTTNQSSGANNSAKWRAFLLTTSAGDLQKIASTIEASVARNQQQWAAYQRSRNKEINENTLPP